MELNEFYILTNSCHEQTNQGTGGTPLDIFQMGDQKSVHPPPRATEQKKRIV